MRFDGRQNSIIFVLISFSKLVGVTYRSKNLVDFVILLSSFVKNDSSIFSSEVSEGLNVGISEWKSMAENYVFKVSYDFE